MAGFGYKDQFKLISAIPRLNGRFDPNPRVECGFCGFQFNGGPSRQKSHLLGQKGGGVQICTKFESMDPDMFAGACATRLLTNEAQPSQSGSGLIFCQNLMRRMLSLTLEPTPCHSGLDYIQI